MYFWENMLVLRAQLAIPYYLESLGKTGHGLISIEAMKRGLNLFEFGLVCGQKIGHCYRDRRVERHYNVFKPLGISDVYYCLII